MMTRSLTEFEQRFGDEDTCAEYLAATRRQTIISRLPGGVRKTAPDRDRTGDLAFPNVRRAYLRYGACASERSELTTALAIDKGIINHNNGRGVDKDFKLY